MSNTKTPEEMRLILERRAIKAKARALYLASPRTPEQIAKDEAAEIKAWRKEYREGIKRELAAQQAAIDATKSVTQDPTWAGLEWSPGSMQEEAAHG